MPNGCMVGWLKTYLCKLLGLEALQARVAELEQRIAKQDTEMRDLMQTADRHEAELGRRAKTKSVVGESSTWEDVQRRFLQDARNFEEVRNGRI